MRNTRRNMAAAALARYSPEEWYEFAEEAHKIIFREHRDKSLDRIDFALIAGNGKDPIGYVTCRELDSESVYWQFGGAMDEFRGIAAFRGFQGFLGYSKERYKRISTLVENTNVKYLHMLMKMGFLAIGIRNYKGQIFLEMHTEFWDVA